MSEPPGRRDHEPRPSPVIGAEMAAPLEAEERRMAYAADASPMPDETYDPWQGHLNLYDPVPLPLDAALSDLLRGYRLADPPRRATQRVAISLDGIYTLLTFARRATVFAIRSRDASTVLDGLAACAAVDAERVDQRDVLVAIALLDHAARSIGAPADVLIGETIAIADSGIGALLSGYVMRPARERHLRDAWGFVDVSAPGGPGLLPWGFRPWMPTSDLTAVGAAIAAAISRDDYRADDPILAAEMPLVWLSGSGDRALGAIAGSSRGTVIVHGRLRPEARPDHAGQQLTVFALEVSHPEAADRLATMSRYGRPDAALLGVGAGPLFALVVARSWRRGVDAFETTDSLERFEPELREVLERGAFD